MSDVIDQRWTASPDAAVSRVGDEYVLLHLVSGTYFGLDPVGSRIWDGLQADRSPREICASIAAEFGQDPEQVGKDVDAFLSDLAEHRLIERR